MSSSGSGLVKAWPKLLWRSLWCFLTDGKDVWSCFRVTKRKKEESCSPGVLQCRGPAGFCKRMFWTKIPETCDCKWTCLSWSNGFSAGSRGQNRRPPYHHHSKTTAFSDSRRICALVPWRQQHSQLGQSTSWWWQLGRPRNTQMCAADSIDKFGIFCHPGRWLCRDVGRSR